MTIAAPTSTGSSKSSQSCSIPNVASDTQNIRKNAALIVEMMKQRFESTIA